MRHLTTTERKNMGYIDHLTNMDRSRILEQVADTIEKNPDQWIQNAFAVKDFKGIQVLVPFNDPEAERMCAEGRIARVLFHNWNVDFDTPKHTERIREVVAELMEPSLHGSLLETINDHSDPDLAREVVVRTMRQCAFRYRQRER